MRKYLIIIPVLIIFSCQRNDVNKSSSRFFSIEKKNINLDCNFFEIIVPSTWKKADDDTIIKTVDFASGRIQIGDHEFISYVNGPGVINWSESPFITSSKDRDIFKDSSYIIISDDVKSIDTSKLKIHHIWNEKVSGFNTKFFEPLIIGYGHTGIFIDSLSQNNELGKFNFTLFADKLDSTVNSRLIEAVRSIKFKPVN